MSIVKPLKLIDDDEEVPIPQEFTVSDDYVAAKGLAIEGLSTHTVDRSGNHVQVTDPCVGTRKAVDFLRYSLMMGGG